MDKYSAAIIGTGRIGFSLQFDKKREQPASHSLALKKNERITLLAGVDISKENLEKWHSFYKSSLVYSSVDEMIKHQNPDIIVVAVNESSHLDVTLKAISANPKLIILEKPVALNIQDGFEIKKQSELHNVPIIINHERRYSLDYIKAKNLIDSGELGDIEFVYANLSSSLPVFNQNEQYSGAYSLIHDGTHLLDIINFLVDIKLENPIITRISKDKKSNIRNLSVSYKNKNILCNIDFSGKTKYFGFDLEIKGTKGKILIGNGYLKYYKAQKSPFYTGFYSLIRDKNLIRPKKTKYFSNMIQNAIDFLDGKSSIHSSLNNGIDVLKSLKEIEFKIQNYEEIYEIPTAD